ncbi:hypothetical protein CVT25_015134 [Psilocybe cyanescens]|uniref:Bud22 domain-containing protein n=1 Tax=Psilocybe cyanescens TaxID=93625 RepID=A0A409WR64_PSICY|nr:hypothetical protein CVT25_015134 [Psilocybe cyanescens]
MDTSSNPQLKRKRYEPPEEEMSIRIAGKLHHEVKEVHKASKRAKVFETQKVVKRLKDLRKKDEADKAIMDFEAELTSLKEIDHDAIGNSALRSKVLKDHTLRDNDDVKAAMTKELENNLLTPATPGTTLAKIQSRLLSSKILALQVTATITSLKYLLDPVLKQREKGAESDILLSSTVDPDSERPSKIRKASASETPKTNGKPEKTQPTFDIDHDMQSGSDVDEEGWESGSVDGEGGAGVDDDGWESGSIDGGGHEDNASDNDSSDDQDDTSEEDSDSDDEELAVKKTNAKPKIPVGNPAKPVKGSTTKMESTFLPSLSVGFVRGGSEDSDFSEGEGKSGGVPKKNRRGQRARRLIWEKKFGKNANHKKKEIEANAIATVAPPQSYRNKGHTSATNTGSNAIPSRNFTPVQGPAGSKNVPPRGKGVQQQHQPVDSGWTGRTNGASAASSFKPKPPASKPDLKKDGEKPLHPSWEAKRRLKEKESVGIVPSQGTKIKFT